MSQQNSWLWCENCGGLFFAGNNNMGVCPSGGTHNPRHSGAYALSTAPPGEGGWRWCANCQGLFFAGDSPFSDNNWGVCPTHSDADSGNYFLPQSSGDGQGGWSKCNKCQGLFYNVAGQQSTAGVAFNCAAGGSHDGTGSAPYYIPQSQGSGRQSGWKWCSQCFGLFFAENNDGGCPCGGAHDGNSSGLYFVPESQGNDLEPGWKFCNQCQGLFFAGDNLGVCPLPGHHVVTRGSDNYFILQTGSAQWGSSEQSGWNWCDKCHGLFYPSNTVWCPSRLGGQPGNQPGWHDGWQTPGNYVLTRLGGDYNYVLYNSNGTPLQDVSVTIDITKDIVCEFADESIQPPNVNGCSFQLNAYSPTGSTIAWQQYTIYLVGNDLRCSVDNWPLTGANLINQSYLLASLPLPKIPEGYRLIMFLSSDSNGNVAEATFNVSDNNSGEQVGRMTILLTGLNLQGVTPPTPVTSAYLAPIVAFELDFVGPINSENVVLSSGAGLITYPAFAALTASNQLPSNAASTTTITAENANSIYEVLPASPGNQFTQRFSIFPVEL